MEEKSKLKPLDEYAHIGGLIVGIILIVLFGVIWNLYGEYTVDIIAGILLGLGGIVNLFVWITNDNLGVH